MSIQICANFGSRPIHPKSTVMKSEQKNPLLSRKSIHYRIIFFRCLVVFCLLVIGGFGAGYGYKILFDFQENDYRDHYKSFSNGIYTSLQTNMQVRVGSGQSFASAYGAVCKNNYDWPNCWIPSVSFDKITQPVIQSFSTKLSGLLSIVRKNELSSFEDFAYSMYEAENFPPETGVSSFGKGVWAINPTSTAPDLRYHDVNGTNPLSKHTLWVVSYLSNINQSSGFMYNLHSNPARVEMLDRLIDCYETKSKNCRTTQSDFVQLVVDDQIRPSTILINSISPEQNQSSLVGFASIIIYWDTVLASSAPSFLDGIHAVVETETSSNTFLYNNGVVDYLGVGDLHEEEFDDMRFSFVFECDLVEGSPTYTVNLYPSKAFYNHYHTHIPVSVCIFIIVIVTLTSLVFFWYDFFVKTESIETMNILHTRQKYVRFISHEIRTPLNISCLGMKVLEKDLQLVNSMIRDNKVMDRADKEKVLNALEGSFVIIQDVVESSDAAVLVLNDLINYDKIENKTYTIDLKPIKPETLLTSSLRPLSIQARQAEVSLVWSAQYLDNEVDNKNFYIIGDFIKLGQVLRNIVSNALKFSLPKHVVTVRARWNPNGLPTYSVPALADDAPYKSCDMIPSGSISVEVVDTGPGLSEIELTKLFGEGVQFNPNDLQAGQGSGLGLWISKGIVEHHHGMLSASSEGTGKGSTFKIELPLVTISGPSLQVNCERSLQVSMDRSSRQISRHLSTPVDLESPLRWSHVLVVDDTTTNRKILMRALRSDGHEHVDEAKDGKECVNMVMEKGLGYYSLILMDYEMPVMNGPAATELLRQKGFVNPIFGVTGNVLEVDVIFFKSKGANAVLPKPVMLKQIYIAYNNIYSPV